MLRCRCPNFYSRRTFLSSIFSSKNRKEEKLDDGKVDPLQAYTMFGGIRKPKRNPFHYTDRKSGTGYSHFSNTIYWNRPYIWPPMRKWFKLNIVIATVGMLLISFDYEWLIQQLNSLGKLMKPEASQLNDEIPGIASSNSNSKSDMDSVAYNSGKSRKKRIGFRERRIIEYEDRIRLYSTPDKIFRYFATLKVIDKDDDSGRFEIFMTPEDFLRSITPGVMQPRKYGLDSYRTYLPDKYKHKFSDQTNIFYKLGENGLISFSDYLFLMTLLSTSPSDFALAFKIFDINGDGTLDKDEFTKVQHLIMSQTKVGQRHRDHITPNTSFRVASNSALACYFFGENGKKTLSASKFLEFQENLYNDILRMEFERRDALDGIDGTISEASFGELLLMYAQIPVKRQKIMLKRVKKKFKHGKGVTFEETSAFFEFLYHIEDIDMALHFHRLAGLPINAKLLQRVARKVTNTKLSDHVVDVVITLFDDNMDGKLSNSEMVTVMRRRMRRGLERPRDTGLFRFIDAVSLCTKRAYQGSPFSLN